MQAPRFSIIVPTFDRPEQLGECLGSLGRLEYPSAGFEVIVVDDGGSAPLAEVVPDALSVQLVGQGRSGPAAARNLGAARARGKYLAFVDDDCQVAAGWLRGLEARLAARPAALVGGRTVNALEGNAFSSASQLIIDFVYRYYNADPERATFFASNNLALPAEDFRALGGFDTTFRTSEDRELCARWLRAGKGMAYAPDAVVHHRHALTLGSFLRQHFDYGRGAFRFRQQCARRDGERLRLERAGFYRDLVRFPYTRASGTRASGLALLLILSQFTSAIGFGWESVRRSPRGH